MEIIFVMKVYDFVYFDIGKPRILMILMILMILIEKF